MQLKKIELQGFKSFADKTEIVFLDGITTIVGPNGSGKSNISDALRWVLGEQSVKTLRGSKMEDVIFAGTQVRKKVGFAEVSMYLDNSDATLPVEYKEVVVTRRVYRTGESDYLINDNECRLKDIQEMFMDTGVGKDGYSIISQGKIDEILSSKSEERRHIFEEASGIVKYRTRKEEASRKLVNTESTLNRVNDILVEIENVIGPLEKKAEVAKKYLVLKEELKTFDVLSFIHQVEENNNNLGKLDEVVSTFENDITKEEDNVSKIEAEKENVKERLQEVSSKIEETQTDFYEMNSKLEKINSSIDIANTNIQNNKQNIVRLNEEVVEDTEKITTLNEEIEQRLEKRKSMSDNKIKFETELGEKQKALNEILLTLDNRGVEIETLKEEIDAQEERKYDIKVELSSIEATIEANDTQIEERRKTIDRSITQKDSISSTKDDIYLELNKMQKEQNKLQESMNIITKEKEEKNGSLNEFKAEEAKMKQELLTLNSKYHYLVNLEKENEGYYKSVREALEYAKGSNSVYGTLASIISTDEKYEYAIEIALGGYLQNIVVQDESDAQGLIAYLKQNMLGRATFLPLNLLKENSFDLKNKVSKAPGFIGVASDLVRFDKKFSKAIHLSLGSTIIVDTIDNAIKISKNFKNSVRIVTLEGELISTTGSITGGQTSHSKTGLLGRSEKIQKLKESIEEKQNKLDQYTKEYSNIENEMVELEKTIAISKEKLDAFNIEIATYNEKYENIKRELEKVENSKENTQNLLKQLEEQNNSLKAKIEENEKEIEQIEIENSKKQEIVDEYARFNKEKQQEIDFLNEDVVNLKISLSSFDESVSSIDEMKEKIEQDIANFNFGINRKKEQIVIEEDEITKLEEQIKEYQNQIEEQSSFKEEYSKITEELKNSKEELANKQEKMDIDILATMRKVDKIKEEKAKVESKKVKFTIELENLKNKMWEEYELTISSAKKLVETFNEDLTPKQIEKKADIIRTEIKDLGEVTVGAIEEYKTTKERYDFISNQREDLEQTKNKLNNLIANMTSIMKTQFEKQFKVITENFNETFKELFGGGKADLKLSDENNILESGIEIEVQPPGKKLQNMMLLSGGERALTATALLFAILKIKSPPFCILDEIEAALDDVNVHRFAEYIKKYSKQTQFIVITHRKGTMEVASSTYGVTMQEYGISKIVSMKLK
ncbi:MAG: chromosome segregation protein SMC [Clostridia bacterium]|nr:chromosome segregation protein SMC [Clostridia bacterium]